MSLRLLLPAVLVAALTAPGDAAPAARVGLALAAPSYNAFDLAARHIPINAAILQGSAAIPPAVIGPLACAITADGSGALTIDAGSGATDCAFFHAPSPDDLTLQVATHAGTHPIKLAFDGGLGIAFKAHFVAGELDLSEILAGIPLPQSATALVAFFDTSEHRWRTAPIERLLFHTYLAPGKGTIYLRIAEMAPIYAIAYDQLPQPQQAASWDCGSDEAAARKGAGATYRDLEYNPVVCVDQATPDAQPVLTKDLHNVVPEGWYGLLLVRHWPNVVPSVSFTGGTVALASPIFDGTGATALKTVTASTPAQGRSLVRRGGTEHAPGDAPYVVSAFLISPHSPGAFHLDLSFVDPSAATDAKADDKTAKQPAIVPTGIDMITDQSYAGALQLGVGYLSYVHDRHYSPVTAAGGSQPDILESSTKHPLELVLGYTAYFANHTYHVGYDDEWWRSVLRHTGLFVGFGALTYSSSNFDFLRSVHLGLDIQPARHVSLALTGVVHREDVLASPYAVDQPAPLPSIPTETKYALGVGLVLTVSSEFFEFTTKQAGVSK